MVGNCRGNVLQGLMLVVVLVLFSVPARLWGAGDATDTLQPYLSNTFSYDDNIFRVSDAIDFRRLGSDRSRGDFINRALAGLKIVKPVGRQEFVLDGSAAFSTFVNNSFLDNFNSDLNGKWNWQVGNDWNGFLSYGYKRYLGGFTNTSFFGKDILSDHRAQADINYWFHPSWRLNAQYRWLDSQHSAEQRRFLDISTNTGLVGLLYQSTKDNYVGLQYRYSSGDLPNRELDFFTATDNSYSEFELSATANYRFTGKSAVEGYFGWSGRNHKQFSQRDYDGPVGHLTFHWSPTPITLVDLSGFRELRSALDLTASFLVAEGVRASLRWLISEKLSLTTRFSYESWTYSGNPNIVLLRVPSREDSIFLGSVQISYEPLRNLILGVGYEGAGRSSNRLFVDYVDNAAFVSIAFSF